MIDNFMTAKDFLTRPHRLKAVIKAKEIRLDKLRDLSSSISGCSAELHSTAGKEPVQKSG